jgi:hypothetical protein
MSVYNGERYLKQAVDSILTQTYKDFEFLIINDGSFDGTAAILKGYHDPRIKIIDNQKKIGLTRSLNKGLRLARGEYIARQDADDISLPERLTKQVSFLDDHQDIDVLGCAVQIINNSGKPSIICKFPTEHGYIKWCLYFYNPIPHPTVMMRRRTLEPVGGYSAHRKYAQDYDLWSRMSEMIRFANLSEILFYLRKHEDNISHSQFILQWKDSIKISQKLISKDVGRKVPLDLVHGICSQHFKTLGESFTACKIIAGLYYASTINGALSRYEKRMVRKDVTSRLLTLVSPRMRNRHMWRIVGLVFLLDSLLFLGSLARHLHNAINKSIH